MRDGLEDLHMPKPRAFLFDLDDTIITEGARHPILVQIAEEFAALLAPDAPVDVADALEGAFRAFWSSPGQAKAARLGSSYGIAQAREMVIADTLLSRGIAGLPEVASDFCKRFTTLRSQSAKLFDGAYETLVTIRKMGVPLALVTNGAADYQRAKLERFDLAGLFDHVQIEGEYGIGKPQERAYSHALAALGVEASGTWMVGDDLERDVAAPQRLGIHAIWHDHLGRGLPTGTTVTPDRIIRRLPELLPFV
jgi:putative hydrolase of the HAD superfamily